MLHGLQYAILKINVYGNLLSKAINLQNLRPAQMVFLSTFRTMLHLQKGKLFVTESGGFRQVTGKIFCFDEDGKGNIWHHGPFNFANGSALSKNEEYLYVVCTWLPGVERIAINADGTAGKREVYCILPKTCPDGIAFDNEENLYVSCYAPNSIFKVNKDQEVSLLINDWEAHTLSNPTNIAFGGNNFNELFTTNLGRWHISKINVQAEGKLCWPLAIIVVWGVLARNGQ